MAGSFEAKNYLGGEELRDRLRDSWERRSFTNFSSQDECAAYLTFVDEDHNRHRSGRERMHLWKGDKIYDSESGHVCLTKADRVQRIENERVKREGPLVIPVIVETFDKDTTPEVDPEIPADADPTSNTPDSLHWQYVHTMHREGNRAESEDRFELTTVCLYIGVDGNGDLQDRMVIKTLDYSAGTPSSSVTAPNPIPDAETRAAVQRLSARYRDLDQLDSEYILRNRCWRESDRSVLSTDNDGNPITDGSGNSMRVWYHGIRSFTDFCDGGDLEMVVDDYNSQDHSLRHSKIPEMFLCKVIHEIAKALFILQTGRQFFAYPKGADPRDAPGYGQQQTDILAGWVALLHRDIKPANIFLRSQDDGYPQAVLADFDLAIRLTPNEGDVPEPLGTPTYISPETVRGFRDDNPQIHNRLTVKADMWSFGSVIWELMHIGLGIDVVNAIQWEYHDDMEKPEMDSSNEYPAAQSTLTTAQNKTNHPRFPVRRYTRRLKELVENCTATDPNSRPNPRELVEEAQRMWQDMHNLIDGDPSAVGSKYDFGNLRVRNDQFQMGEAHEIRRQRQLA